MRLITTCLTAMALAVPAAAQRLVDPGSFIKPEPRTIAEGPDSLPLTFVGGRPVVKVAVGDGEPRDFILDTGAGATLVDQRVAASLGLTGGQPMRVRSPFGDEGMEATLHTVSRMRLGQTTLENVRVVVLDLSKVAANLGDGIAGILSTGTLTGRLVTIDYAGATLLLEPGALPEPDGRTVFGYQQSRRLPGLQVTIGSRIFDADLDTGSGSSLTLPEHWIDSLVLTGTPTRGDTLRTVDRVLPTRQATLKEPLRIGAFGVPDVEVRFLQVVEGPVTIGQGILRNFKLTLDPANRRIRLEPGGGVRRAVRATPPVTMSPRGPATEAGTTEIIAAARDYIDGFFGADTARMRRALHPRVAKRRITGHAGTPENQTADQLVALTAQMRGRASGTPLSADSIRILDRSADMATVRIGVSAWIDYLHLARFGDRWQIINVAWQTR